MCCLIAHLYSFRALVALDELHMLHTSMQNLYVIPVFYARIKPYVFKVSAVYIYSTGSFHVVVRCFSAVQHIQYYFC